MAGVELEAGRIELLNGRPDLAVASMQAAVDRLNAMGDRGHLVTIAAILADALLVIDRDRDAESLLDIVDEWAMVDDLDPQIGRRRVRAKLLARRGEFETAERLGREAVELARGTDFIIDHAHAREDYAEVLRRAAVQEMGGHLGLRIRDRHHHRLGLAHQLHAEAVERRPRLGLQAFDEASSRGTSRRASRAAMSRRLSWSCLPRARPSSTFARPRWLM